MMRLLLTILLLSLLPIITANISNYEFENVKKSTAESSSLFTRYDRKAYNIAAGYDFNSTLDDLRSKYGNFDKESIKRKYFMKTDYNFNDNDNSQLYDQCTTYLAPSSIPNSGLGMYTTIPYFRGDSFLLPEIGIMLQDKDTHYPQGSNNLLHQYPWGAGVITGGHQEVAEGSVMSPGMGMLANSHLGLKNIRLGDIWRLQVEEDGTDSKSVEGQSSSTLNDVGRGSYSYHSRLMFDADRYIQSGEEFFVNYGDDWFTARENLLGVIPSETNYQEADRMLQKLDDECDSHAYEALLKDAAEKDKRLRAALPDNVEDVPDAKDLGTARFSARTSIRSVEWIEENGVCIDNIISGTSTIPQAGQGAFATRNLVAGTIITTTPVVTLEREQLQLWEEVDGGDVGVKHKKEDKVLEMVGQQLLMNYCYGHVNSSLLLFPYSPTVNFINHGSNEEANAEIRWSEYSYHKREWLDLSMEEMKKLMKTGLMLDIVATKDIPHGDEVLLNYGQSWEKSWIEHIGEWNSDENNDDADFFQKNLTDTLGVRLNQRSYSHAMILTVDEQKSQPYPSHLETVCRFKPSDETCQQESNGYCKLRWTMTMNELHDHPCDVISRTSIDEDDWYFVHLNITDKATNKVTQYQVEFLPRYAIRFLNRKYTKDQYARGVFREVIGLPDGLYPDHWMDLKEDDRKYLYQD